jgi:hypothetical protein
MLASLEKNSLYTQTIFSTASRYKKNCEFALERHRTFWLHSNRGAHSAHGVEGATRVVAVGGAAHPGHGEGAQEQILPLLAHVGVVVQYSGLCTCKR